MTDISSLEGITSSEVNKFCREGIKTVEEFLARVEPPFVDGIAGISQATNIKPDRLIELVPPENLEVESLPDQWLEALAGRLLREVPFDDPWVKRCWFGVERFGRGLKGNWKGWKENVPIVLLITGLLLLLALTLRAAGGFKGLPSPLGLHDRTLITARSIESGKVLRSGDLYLALLPPESDYFKPDDNLEGLVLARSISGQMPLRFRDVLRQQVIAAKDIQADTIVQKEDVTLTWTAYRPGAALRLEEVYGRKTTQAIRKDTTILSEFIKPAE